MIGQLILKSGLKFEGESFGAQKSVSGEMVFSTGMVGYPESLTDPSYRGQILVLTYPLIGNYGVPEKSRWESGKIQISALIVSSYIDTPSHHASLMTLSEWLKKENIPGLEIKDTRAIAQHLANKGATLGKMTFDRVLSRESSKQSRSHSVIPEVLSAAERLSGIQSKEGSGSRLSDAFGRDDKGWGGFEDPNLRNLVSEVSCKKLFQTGKGKRTVILIDCGTKQNIIRELVKRGVKVMVVPWDYDFKKIKVKYQGVVVSNGPGDPKLAGATINTIKSLLAKKKPILGICLGNQILALAAGGDTYKLKFGHRGQNQPCLLKNTQKLYLTTQNHGFAVGKIPKGFRTWFINANDHTNEGLIHKSLPFMSVQFHPEASPGPTDTAWVFDEFLNFTKN